MKKSIWIKAALSASAFGLFLIRPWTPVSAAETGIMSKGSIVYENGTDSVAVYAEDITLLKEKLGSVRAKVYIPAAYEQDSLEAYGSCLSAVEMGETSVLQEDAETEAPKQPEGVETEAPEQLEDAETETPAPQEDAAGTEGEKE